jgi:hypothetical protein
LLLVEENSTSLIPFAVTFQIPEWGRDASTGRHWNIFGEALWHADMLHPQDFILLYLHG